MVAGSPIPTISASTRWGGSGFARMASSRPVTTDSAPWIWKARLGPYRNCSTRHQQVVNAAAQPSSTMATRCYWPSSIRAKAFHRLRMCRHGGLISTQGGRHGPQLLPFHINQVVQSEREKDMTKICPGAGHYSSPSCWSSVHGFGVLIR